MCREERQYWDLICNSESDVISLVIHSGFTGLFLAGKNLIHTFALGIGKDNRGKILLRNLESYISDTTSRYMKKVRASFN